MKAHYICNCINYNDIFSDTTAMAQAVDQSKTISQANFYKLVNILLEHKKLKKVKYSQVKNLFILYDINRDIHYFYL
jgi:hypothetical protein